MSRPSFANGTPCPVPARRFSNTSTLTGWADETTEVDYTRVVRAEFQHARPKRPRKRFEQVKIFEDVVEGEELVVSDRAAGRPGGTLLGRRPQRKVGGVVLHGNDRPAVAGSPDAWALAGQVHKPAVGRAMGKEARRRTIFVPSDETTMMTIHPGARDTETLEDTFQLMNLEPTASPHSEPVAFEQHNSAQRPQMSLAVAPRRLPLQMLQGKSDNLPDVNVNGKNGGKENEAPGVCGLDSQRYPKDGCSPELAEKTKPSKPSLFAPTASSLARQSAMHRDAVPRVRSKAGSSPATLSPRNRLDTGRPISVHASHHFKPARSRASPQQNSAISAKAPQPRGSAMSQDRPWRSGSNYVSVAQKARSLVQAFPVLATDVDRPGLYEDRWLDHEEIALTAVINEIFNRAQPSPLSQMEGTASLKESMLEIYQGPNTVALHERLQASLTYGALGKPSNSDALPALAQDLGQRKRYLSLWLESYDFAVLQIAAEIVVGRSVARSDSDCNSSEARDAASLDRKASRRGLISFLETFFVTAADVNESGHRSDADAQLRVRSKTTIRSLMLIYLLDRVATAQPAPFCLFKKRSTHKSSASMLTALARLLLPSLGDIGRVLRHLEYEVSYVQDPLDEVSYHIDNIAVDLRDGIFLTRLVEILLFPHSAASNESFADTPCDDLTITLSDPTVLLASTGDKTSDEQPQSLSQHLKMPCLGHAQKAYNVDIALSVLRAHLRSRDLVPEHITPTTIVDGHREHTLNLLWTLISTLGIDQLLDRCSVEADIHVHTASRGALEHLDTLALLHRWAAAHCAAKDVVVSNLTTSFADGKVYTAITSSFAPFLARRESDLQQPSASSSDILLHLGCSAAFVKHLLHTSSIPSRTTTLANLTYLAMKLLPLAGQYRAAVTIQRAVRARRSGRVAHERVVLMRMAYACSTIVVAKQKTFDAIVRVQRTWRGVRAARAAELDARVCAFQSAARAWRVRRHVQTRKKGGRATEAKAMGGW
ncbi:hypothetical protein B0A48_03158 [Cryoendolithus antarcticus]|uniref:Calponin-homology (CH) domain-containing protein n=1 Tax=Cryoendolithus antarcticus TaxID=1507870 RepID=A0A1V8TMC3_9PEZI|nr:hypothetical protein B0A48_03158 [Cryoendolithus antarcticus]